MTLIEFLAAGSVALVVGVLAALVLAWLVRLVYQEVCERREKRTEDVSDKQPVVVVSRSPLLRLGPRHASMEYARETPGYEARHRDASRGDRTPAESPIRWADTSVMEAIPDGPFTEEFRGITGLDPAVPVLRSRTLRSEGHPQAAWAQQALALDVEVSS